MTTLLVNIIGLFTIALIIWWFWLSRPKAQLLQGEKPVEILVQDGVYRPSRIQVAIGKPVTLMFTRKDPSPCAEKVVFDDLNISQDLALDQTTEIKIIPDTIGEHEFTCQMKMYRGSLVVTE